MADIKITFSEVRTKATAISKCNSNLKSYLEKIKSEIVSLDAEWTSDSSDTIRGKITNMQAKFDNYYNIIDSYVKFLNTTATQYEQTESAINTNANAFN
ncbi:MAG: pore-forming ESAT-6 family protein [Lachnospiraceae bacterium]|nr:pore-forming ESAT-6 family protein [Lachnospiraceae bacterium]